MDSAATENNKSYTVQKHWRATQERVEKFLSENLFTDANLRGRLYPSKAKLQSIKHHFCSRGLAYHEVVEVLLNADEVLGTDLTFRPSWTTHWFKCDIRIPGEWAEKQVRFRWDSGCEAMVWKDGHPVQGLTGSSDNHQLRTDFILSRSAKGGERFILYIEAVANGMFGVGKNGLINPPDQHRQFHLTMAEIAVFDQDVYNLINDLTLLIDMAKNLPREFPRAYEALYTANEIVNLCDPFNKDTFHRCRELAHKFLNEKNGDSQHVLHAIGHCHIDSAWLWPYSETRRKCARSWSSTLRLMQDYPQFTFACSQAQQLQWVKEDYPALFEQIKEKVRTGQFIPVGGTWIEMDGNIPSGESFVRQFLLGQQFFKHEFGHYCTEFWLPDTFGYSAQLPQLMIGAGISYFLSQKLSWNLTNQFPHNSFLWEGIDGSCVIAHFPPADTYESTGNVTDVLKSVRKFRDKGRSRHSILLYGHGDGGGGPTENMMESLKRMEDVDGLPKVTFSTPTDFFTSLSKDSSKLCKWVGELYLELHRGTYTTQAQLKKENRRIEFLLHDLDFITALSFAFESDGKRVLHVREKLVQIWRKFLLNQFHDVLPGSCIQQVAEDAIDYYKEITSQAQTILNDELKTLLCQIWSDTPQYKTLLVNSFSWHRRELVECVQAETVEMVSSAPKRARVDLESNQLTQTLHSGSTVGMVSCEPMSIQIQTLVPVQDSVHVEINGDCFTMENSLLKAVFSMDGLLKSLQHKPTGREAIAPGGAGNQFVLFDDLPLFWDAWDVMEYHLETRFPLTCTGKACVIDLGPLRVSVEVEITISAKSHITQIISLDAEAPYLKFDTKVNWNESHKFLKVEFPFNVHSCEAQYEIQFGHLSRPTHYNISWDQAKFEVCAQKWADLSEHGFGVALLNNCKYGYSTIDNIMRLSLLRSPKAPDESADMGQHSFAYAVMPHKDSLQASGVIQESYNFNHPLTQLKQPLTGACKSFFKLLCTEPSAVILDTVKPPEKVMNESAIVIRLYEAFGGHVTVKLQTSLPVTQYQRCNLLEEPLEPRIECSGGIVPIILKPFQIASYILYLSKIEQILSLNK